jgi:hypothetical protein
MREAQRNRRDLEELLIGWFEYYATHFELDAQHVCILTGQQRKSLVPVFVNPFSPTHNMTKVGSCRTYI